MTFQNTLEFARGLDAKDPLALYRNRFFIPRRKQHEVYYFCGNSLGLQPRETFAHLEQELFDWAAWGVEGHFHSRNPWVSYHELFSNSLAKLCGARPSEVVAMNSLSVNLHLLLVSFYRPEKNRFKIICEHKPFPSDRYALESHIRFHGYDPEEALIELKPRDGEHTLRNEDILKVIEKNKNTLALVMLGGVNYFTGQVFDMNGISTAAHKAGAMAGFDLAHAIGNIKLELDTWEVDFACWCSYKYLNSGPGGVGGIYVNKKHFKDGSIPRFNGWWGGKSEKKFLMENEFSPAESAEAWQLSNAPVLSMAAHRAALDIFDEAGMDVLLAKSGLLFGFLEFILRDLDKKLFDGTNKLELITPTDPGEHGCQISFLAHGFGKKLYENLKENGVITDWREPNVIRLAPVPLYNTFEDIWKFGEVMETILRTEKKV